MPATEERLRALRTALLLPLAALALGSTCVVIEEGPSDETYGEESNAEATQEEMADDVIRDSDR